MTGILARWKPRRFLFTTRSSLSRRFTNTLSPCGGSLGGKGYVWFVWGRERHHLPATTALGLSMVALGCSCIHPMCSTDLLNSLVLRVWIICWRSNSPERQVRLELMGNPKPIKSSEWASPALNLPPKGGYWQHNKHCKEEKGSSQRRYF